MSSTDTPICPSPECAQTGCDCMIANVQGLANGELIALAPDMADGILALSDNHIDTMNGMCKCEICMLAGELRQIGKQ